MRYPDTDSFLKNLGKKIRAIRNDHGLSQRELGLRAEMEKSEIQRLERGTNVTFKTIIKIANALDVDIETLITFTDL